ncbi:MAG: cysteine--tRNA ligase [Chloroflexaceae bacterium]|nr:cysteine--tRNA ligase [Chloroflexaceae bacterium]
MTIQLYNTLTRRVEPLETLEPGVVRMYVCGVTVYDHAHIGHAMSALVFDILRRYLEWRGYRVIHVVNFTDVDDKIIERANARGQNSFDLAESLIQEFLDQLAAFNILPATFYPRATQSIPDMIELIQGLIDRGHAYPADGDVYYRVRSFPSYGKLSGRNLEDTLSGTRFEPDPRKESPADFALWKSARAGEPSWPSPWGPGRPGWHIECSAMNLKYLGEQIDIHGGGNDLIFPHHENEIAQSEGLTGKPFARYWVHNGMLQLVSPQTGTGTGTEKMSKSLGNLVTISDFLRQYPADVFRLMVLNSHYRSPLTYHEEIAAENVRKLERLQRALLPATGEMVVGDAVVDLIEAASTAREAFVQAMDHDFNTASALAALFDLVRAINTARDAEVGGVPFQEAQATLQELAGVVGLRLQEPQRNQEAAPFVDLLLEVRTALRGARQFELADTIRERLDALGVVLEDTPQGTRWRWSYQSSDE